MSAKDPQSINYMSLRTEKLNELIRDHLGEIFSRDLNLKSGILITIAKVDTTTDLRYTRVFVSIFPEKETNYVLTAFKKEIYSIQGKLNKKLKMKIFPKIEFRLDASEIKADEIEKILKKIGDE